MSNQNPKVGDLIEIGSRECYQHWAVCVEENPITVIHLWKGDGDKPAKVRKELLSDVLQGRDYLVNNKYDEEHPPPKDPREIVKRAEAYLNKSSATEPYNIFYNNCEHFATWCRNGAALSDQTRVIQELGTCACCIRKPGSCRFFQKNGCHRT